MSVCSHCGVTYEPSSGWYLQLCTTCFRERTRPKKPKTIAEHIARYCDTHYDRLPDGSYVVVVIDRRPQEPLEEQVTSLKATHQHIRKNRDRYGAPPFFMRCDPVTRVWNFWNDTELQQRVLTRARTWSTLSQLDPDRIPNWVWPAPRQT